MRGVVEERVEDRAGVAQRLEEGAGLDERAGVAEPGAEALALLVAAAGGGEVGVAEREALGVVLGAAELVQGLLGGVEVADLERAFELAEELGEAHLLAFEHGVVEEAEDRLVHALELERERVDDLLVALVVERADVVGADDAARLLRELDEGVVAAAAEERLHDGGEVALVGRAGQRLVDRAGAGAGRGVDGAAVGEAEVAGVAGAALHHRLAGAGHGGRTGGGGRGGGGAGAAERGAVHQRRAGRAGRRGLFFTLAGLGAAPVVLEEPRAAVLIVVHLFLALRGIPPAENGPALPGRAYHSSVR